MHRADLRRLAWFALFVALVNAADLASTYLVSPDLAAEWNVLQRWLGLGWAGLVAAKALGGALAVAAYAFYLARRADCYPAPGADMAAFRRAMAFGDGSLADDARHRLRLLVHLGYFWAAMQPLVLWVAIDNLLLSVGWFFPLRQQTELGYHLLQSAIIGWVAMARFYRANFGLYRALPTRAAARARVRARQTV